MVPGRVSITEQTHFQRAKERHQGCRVPLGWRVETATPTCPLGLSHLATIYFIWTFSHEVESKSS